MSILGQAADAVYSYKFLKLLVTPWDKTDAYKLGIVNADGKPLKKASDLKTSQERNAYSVFNRLVFNIKRLLNKLPLGKTTLASYAAALYLIKENTRMTDNGITKIFDKLEIPVDMSLNENTWFLNDNGQLQPGSYRLVSECPIVSNGEFRAYPHSHIYVKEALSPVGSVLGIPVFFVKHHETQQTICISTEDITR